MKGKTVLVGLVVLCAVAAAVRANTVWKEDFADVSD